jgi:hypothetical protein
MMPTNAYVKTDGPAVKISGHSSNGHGNGAGNVVSGRGLAHRPAADRLALAVAIATGATRLDPSFAQIAAACRVTHTRLREALKAQANGYEDVKTAVAKSHLRAIVGAVGLNNAFDLLNEIDVQLQCEAAGLDVE